MKEPLALEQDQSSETEPSLVVASSADAVLADAVLADAVLADAVLADAVLADGAPSDGAPSDGAPSDAIPPGGASESAPESQSRETRADSLEVSSDEIAIGPYSDAAEDEDDAVTLQMDAPLDDGEWMLQASAHERRRLSTEQLSAERASGALPSSARVWRNGMRAWTPLGEVDFAAELARKGSKENPPGQELAPSSTRPLVPPLAAPPKRTVPVLPSPPPPRLAPSPSRPGFGSALASSPGSALDVGLRSASSRALGPLSSAAAPASSAFGFGATRALGLSPPPPRVEVARPEPVSSALPAFDAPSSASPAARRVDTATSVALDLGPVATQRSRPWGALVAQGIAVVVALVGTSYALTRAGVFEPGAAVHGAAARGELPASTRLALQPAPELAAAPAVTPPAVAPAVAPPGGAPAQPEAEVAAPTDADPRQAAPAGSAPASGRKELSGQTPSASDAAAKPAGEMTSSDKDSPAVEPRSRRAKRARRAAALEARRQRPAVQEQGEPTRAESERPEAVSPPQEPGSTFDRQAAQTALATAAEQAKNCRPIGGPSGAGTVQVQYEPSGRVGSVTIVTPGFENSDTAACIQMLFRRARVPAFNGAKGAVLRQRFEIP